MCRDERIIFPEDRRPVDVSVEKFFFLRMAQDVGPRRRGGEEKGGYREE
jgi:hypothetical protein